MPDWIKDPVKVVFDFLTNPKKVIMTLLGISILILFVFVVQGLWYGVGPRLAKWMKEGNLPSISLPTLPSVPGGTTSSTGSSGPSIAPPGSRTFVATPANLNGTSVQPALDEQGVALFDKSGPGSKSFNATISQEWSIVAVGVSVSVNGSNAGTDPLVIINGPFNGTINCTDCSVRLTSKEATPSVIQWVQPLHEAAVKHAVTPVYF